MTDNQAIPTYPDFKAEQQRLKDWAIQHDQEKLRQAEEAKQNQQSQS